MVQQNSGSRRGEFDFSLWLAEHNDPEKTALDEWSTHDAGFQAPQEANSAALPFVATKQRHVATNNVPYHPLAINIIDEALHRDCNTEILPAKFIVSGQPEPIMLEAKAA